MLRVYAWTVRAVSDLTMPGSGYVADFAVVTELRVVCRVAGPAAGLHELNPMAPAPVVITSASQSNISAYFLPTRANGGSPYSVTLYASDSCNGKGRCMKGVGKILFISLSAICFVLTACVFVVVTWIAL